MVRHIAFLIVCLAWIANSKIARAQAGDKAVVQGQPDSSTCSYNFTSGANNTFLSYCVSVDGNILQVETPLNHPQIFFAEGYGLCNESPIVAYYDYANSGNSASWASSSLLSQTATRVKIARTTADGIWTLTQTITLDKASPGIKIAMALKNNTAAARVAYLVRYGDVDADDVHDNFSATTDGAFGWTSSFPFGANNGSGLELRNVGQLQFGYLQGFARSTHLPPNPCNFAGESSGSVLTDLDGSVALVYADSVGAGKTKTATMIYRGM
jgi:hypothetical protein